MPPSESDLLFHIASKLAGYAGTLERLAEQQREEAQRLVTEARRIQREEVSREAPTE